MHFTIKPVSYRCNLHCDYCFYLPKGNSGQLPPGPKVMSDEVLEAFIASYIAACPGDTVYFTWQGGEPLLAGLDFYRKAFALQAQYAGGKKVENAVQTNGTLINEEWCQLFKEHQVLLGVSIDGPQELHDAWRKNSRGVGSFDEVMAGIELLKRYGIPFNTLTCINAVNYTKPLEVYHFLKSLGSTYWQFSEVVETTPEQEQMGWALGNYQVKPFSLPSDAYGTFMLPLFKQWVRHDVGRIVVRQFESLIACVLGLGHHSCVWEERCPDNFVLEANGDIYECDQTVYPGYKLGNILELGPKCKHDGIVRDSGLAALHAQHLTACKQQLSAQCQACPYLPLCHGGCVKHRIDQGEGAVQSYFCAGYQDFFAGITPYLNVMVHLENNKVPYTAIVGLVDQIEAALKK